MRYELGLEKQLSIEHVNRSSAIKRQHYDTRIQRSVCSNNTEVTDEKKEAVLWRVLCQHVVRHTRGY